MITSRSLYRSRPDHDTAAAEAREQRGVWVPAALYPTAEGAKAAARRVVTGETLAYTAGEFEAYRAFHADGHAVWVRYVAGDEPVPELPDSMTVRLVDRAVVAAEGRGVTVTVTVAPFCSVCGGPRGWDTIRSTRFDDADEPYHADLWTNPCGHEESHAAVLRESRVRPLPAVLMGELPKAPPPLDPPEPGSPAAVILDAVKTWPGKKAAWAADLLEGRGFVEEAERIRAEREVRGVFWSAQAAAHFLHTGGGR